jgi:hypothetical protein
MFVGDLEKIWKNVAEDGVNDLMSEAAACFTMLMMTLLLISSQLS